MRPAVAVAKMSGAGNDFVVLGPEGAASVRGEFRSWVRRVCRRGLSVGADGVLVVTPAGRDRVAVAFYNPDGGEAFCGNGSRCAARFAFVRGFAAESMVLETAAGPVEANVRGDRVRLTLPPARDLGALTVDVPGFVARGRVVDAGVPHFVLETTDLATAPLERFGPALRRHRAFGEAGANVDFVSSLAADPIGIRTWERGVEGETLSCGSGAVAAAFLARLAGGPESVSVLPRSGVPLKVSFPGAPTAPSASVLEGDARFVFEAELPSEATEGFPVS